MDALAALTARVDALEAEVKALRRDVGYRSEPENPPRIFPGHAGGRRVPRPGDGMRIVTKYDLPRAVRTVIHSALYRLLDDLGDFEQTTHGSIFDDGTLDSVLAGLKQCYESPGRHSISELDQRIRKFLDHDERRQERVQ